MLALDGFAKWLEHWLSDQRVEGSVPVKVMYLVADSILAPEGACKRGNQWMCHSQIDVYLSSLSFFLPLSLWRSMERISLGEIFLKIRK